jgi:hypothetical protein
VLVVSQGGESFLAGMSFSRLQSYVTGILQRQKSHTSVSVFMFNQHRTNERRTTKAPRAVHTVRTPADRPLAAADVAQHAPLGHNNTHIIPSMVIVVRRWFSLIDSQLTQIISFYVYLPLLRQN